MYLVGNYELLHVIYCYHKRHNKSQLLLKDWIATTCHIILLVKEGGETKKSYIQQQKSGCSVIMKLHGYPCILKNSKISYV